MPDFRYPNGWHIYPVTPSSSFKNGVKIISYQSGRIHFKVDILRFLRSFDFTVYVFDGLMIGGLKLPADALLPSFAHFEVRRNIHGLIDINMPLVFA